MSDAPIDELLIKLNSGDTSAARQVYDAYEPYLRMVVRRQLSPALRTKFDSLDVVQSVWVHMLHGFREAGWRFTDREQLRGFLMQLASYRFIDRVRRHRLALRLEQPLTDMENMLVEVRPNPTDVITAHETWERILKLCPAGHRPIVHMKRAGAVNAEVARVTGLNVGSVRRILHRLYQRLAQPDRDVSEMQEQSR